MTRRLLLLALALAVLGALAAASPGLAQTTSLFPGVTYERDVQFTPHGPVALHVVRGPRPVGLYRLRPVLSNESVLGRETVSAMQTRLAAQATMVGVNGDYSRFDNGRPSGIVLRDGVLATPPSPNRSSAGITLDGLLDVRRVKFVGTWRGTGSRRTFGILNDSPGPNGVALFTSDWGPATPRIAGSVALVLTPFPSAVPNTELVAPVASIVPDGPVALAPGTAVLVARGNAAVKLQAEAPVGTPMRLRLVLDPQWSEVSDAIGGGPVLVRDGKAIFSAGEGFTVDQIAPRHPRTAVGQLADGRIILVVVDGRQQGYSIGLTTFELALTMRRLGAVRAMQLDSGGSSAVAFNGKVLNSPSDGSERPIGNGLMLQYYGVYAPPPLVPVVSPNGDGVAETQKLSYKIVRPATVTLTLTAPDGTVAAQESGPKDPGTYEVAFPPVPPPPLPPVEGQPPSPPVEPGPPAEGRWTLVVSTVDDQGIPSSVTKRFSVNTTIGYLRVTPSRLVLRKTSSATAPIRWRQARAAQVKVTIETREGIVLRTVSSANLEPGEQVASWDGRSQRGKLVGSGSYVVRVTATNDVGSVSLTRPLAVRAPAGAKS